MRRREFIMLLGGSAAAWPLPSRAQQRKAMPRVGVLWHAADAKQEEEYLGALTKAFHELGYVEGKNIELDHRFPAEQPERFRTLAQELADNKVDVIVAVTGLGAKEAKRATATIPIVIVADPDPIGNGLVESLARPGGNVTGLSLMTTDVSGKRLALFKQIVPKLARLAFVVDPRDPTSKPAGVVNEREAKAAGLSIQTFGVTTPDEIEQAFSVIARDGFDGAFAFGPPLYNERAQVGASAMAHKVPTIASNAQQVPYGLLMSYGPDFLEYFRRAAGYVDNILKGAKPGDLPIQQPTRIKLVINLKAAKALDISVPPSLQATADEIIE
ncbi:ABC transporter substrate-binding protein [Bradyrhizobium manausense]|uniref:ABC transporter substrate-binding protein n=1 Tax=Bradyrhizobium manausense TaxID=989370 RepID=UPI001BAA2FBF|nr:ABC transporter substrate-binding protein [Bradyrhizobium manausense]MBR0827149.1 ABC transporter substrate-binding protein [Bradyrhizobium manausense]